MSFLEFPTPVQEISSELFLSKGVQVFVKREDLIHPEIMGNKWRKLKYNLLEAQSNKVRTLVTFGGAYSNHIAATAAAANEYGFRSIGIIRGDELGPSSNPTLEKAQQNGMMLLFVSRADFRKMKVGEIPLPVEDRNYYVLPEGGTNELAINGVAEITEEITEDFDIITTPVGTGGTLAGLVKGMAGDKFVLGFSAVKGQFIVEEVADLLKNNRIPWGNYKVETQFHFGGYGKFDDTLIDFMGNFYHENNLVLEPIYTGKMFFGVWEMIKNEQIASGNKILMLHTGGLQGVLGFNERFGSLIPDASGI
ncbi:MAG: pyridoxal-phosphate dependent enzyme [Cyclobacteriaceae bacterium]|nr:pyridoxal-phosphate dependent enzyme [Cyclobacteriaceae bacterium HetDA_MAG_MS6]